MNRYLIVGNGVAGTTAAEHIRKEDPDGKITIITDEGLPFYYRLRMNEFISGEIDEIGLIAKSEKWYRDRQIELSLKTRITGGDPDAGVILGENEQAWPYDRLLIATGSRSFVPPIQGSEKRGVFSLRSIQDARSISSYAEKTEKVVLIGGGLLGLEAGNALRKLGKEVTIVEFFPRLLPRQLDADGARLLQSMMEEMGFSFRLGAKTQEVAGTDQVEGVFLEGGEKLSAQMVIISAGVRPNMELAGPLGLEQDKGIKVDDRLRTNQPNIYAAGDVAEFRGMLYGIWTAAMDQGKIAGANMAGDDTVYPGTIMSNTLKVVGIDLASAGDIDVDAKLESRIMSTEKIYRKVVIENHQIRGCIMLGETKGFNQIVRAMSGKKDIRQFEDVIIKDDFDFKSL